MAGRTRLRFEFFGEVQLDRTIARVSEHASDLRPAWEILADRFAELERLQFDTEGRHASGGWPALSPRYAAWKAQHYPGKRILERTGDLRRSLTVRPFGVEVVTPQALTVGSDVEYGRYHQLGDGLPRRRPVALTEHARRDWVKIVQRYIITGVATR